MRKTTSSTATSKDDNYDKYSSSDDAVHCDEIGGVAESSGCSSSKPSLPPSPQSLSPLDPLRLIRISMAEGIGGAMAGAIADTTLYAVDSAKVQRQSNYQTTTTAAAAAASASAAASSGGPLQASHLKSFSSTSTSLKNLVKQYKILFRGLGQTVMLGSVPVFGSFFLLYSP